METKIITHITKGVIIALILIVLSITGHLLNIDLESWFGWISIGIFLIGVIWSVNVYGTQMNNTPTFGNLFGHGFKVTAVIICITFIYTLLSVYVIFPDSIDRVMQKGVEKAVAGGKVTSDQMQQNAPMMRKIITISILAGSVFVNALIGAIGALIGAAITKKKPQDPFGNQPV